MRALTASARTTAICCILRSRSYISPNPTWVHPREPRSLPQQRCRGSRTRGVGPVAMVSNERFLEAFAEVAGGSGALNAIGVLSKIESQPEVMARRHELYYQDRRPG